MNIFYTFLKMTAYLTKYCFIVLMSFLATSTMAQVDKEFWFAVPYVGRHGNGNSEMVVSNMSKTNVVNITLTNPASPVGGLPLAGIIRSIPAGGTIRIDLNQYYKTQDQDNGATPSGSLQQLYAPNTINNTGLLIQSNDTITAYYEVGSGGGQNCDIFALKGSNALGTAFMLPFQNHYENWEESGRNAYSAADIVATTDGTLVTITPTKAAVGRPAGAPFTITLNRGQTYSLRAFGKKPEDHMSGTTVTSTKPIAITLIDDSINSQEDATWDVNISGGKGGIDMAGDQIVPLSVIGKEYIIVRGNAGNGTKNRIFILTTQPNTKVEISENRSIVSSTIYPPAGFTEDYVQPVNSPASYIKSDKPIYVFYISGSESELGGALIPPIQCTGSSNVVINRTSPNPFYFVILAKNKILNNFVIDGSSTIITRAKFQSVVGAATDPEGFSSAKLDYANNTILALSATNFPQGTGVLISNTFPNAVFHVGTANGGGGGEGSTARFGYFSDFNSINISYANKPVCFGEKLVLDAGPGRDSYKWYTKTGNVENTLFDKQVYEVTTPGQQKIYLRIEKKGCPLVDSVDVFIQPKVNLSILRKKIACDNQPVTMDATPEVTTPPLKIVDFVWYSASPTIPDVPTDTFARTQNVSAKFPVSLGSPPVPHKIKIKVIDDKGCVSTDSVEVIIRPTPPVVVGTFIGKSACSGDSVQLGGPSLSIKHIYKWLDSYTTAAIKQNATGIKNLFISNPNAMLLNSSIPPVALEHKYYIETTDTSTSCVKLDSLILTINPIPKAQINLTKSKFCKSDSPEVLVGSAPGFTAGTYKYFINYVDATSPTVTQFDPATASLTTASKIKLKYVSAAPASCPAPDVDSLVTVSDKPVVAMTATSYCSGKSVTIGLTKDNLYKYAWTQDLDLAISKLDTHQALIAVKNTTANPVTKNYTLTVTSKTNATCTNKGSVDVVINPQPVASFTTVDLAGIKAIGYCVNSADVTFTGTPAGGSFSSTNTSMVGSTFSPKFIGSNLVKYTVTTFTCIDDTIIDVKVNKLPVPIIDGITKAAYCVGDPALLIIGNAVVPAVGGFTLNKIANPAGNFALATAGNYVFRYGITDANGCTDSTEEKFDIKPLPTVEVSPATPAICLGETATLVALGGVTYIWTGLSSSVGTVVVKPIITSNYSVVAVNTDNCKSVSKAVTVTVNKTPFANFPDKNIEHCFEEGNVSLYAGIASSYIWSEGSITDTLKVSESGFYKVIMVEGICKSSDSVIVVAVCPPRVFLPKAFSPNNDGYNDSLQIFGDHFKDIKFRVFNRWGEVVFESTQKDKMWDGTYNGATMPAGVYPWVLNYKSELVADKNKIFSVDGSVSIID